MMINVQWDTDIM